MTLSDAAPYSIAGAFVLGLLAGFIACLRMIRLVLEYIRKHLVDPD